jgi:hypothetical protein
MNLRSLVAIVAFAALASGAQAQQMRQGPPPPKGPKPTVAEVQKVVASVSADKTKLDAYCESAKIDAQMEEAAKKKDTATMQQLGKRMSELEQKIGPDYVNLMNRLQAIDPNSADGKQLSAPLDELDKKCPQQ